MPRKFLLLAISGKEKLFVKKNFVCLMLHNIFFHKNMVGEKSPPSLFLKEKCPSAKSDVLKVIYSYWKNRQPFFVGGLSGTLDPPARK